MPGEILRVSFDGDAVRSSRRVCEASVPLLTRVLAASSALPHACQRVAVEGLSERELVGWPQGYLDGLYGRVPELPFLH